MHFTTLFILKNKSLEDTSADRIEEIFCDHWCYCCGDTDPIYGCWCDWFQFGGRWSDILKAKKGIHCERCWSNDNAPIIDDEFSIVDICDLTAPIDRKQIYSVCLGDEMVVSEENEDRFNELLDLIDHKAINGIVALIDCHD